MHNPSLAAEPDTIAPDFDDAPVRGDGPWVLIWRRFRRNRLAVVGGVIVILLYLISALAEFVAPYSDAQLFRNFGFAPPQALSLTWVDDAGERQWGLHVRRYESELNLDTMSRSFVAGTDDASIVPVQFLVESEPFLLAGFIPMRHHLIGPVDRSEPMFLIGSDRLGRDVLSRLIFGTRISLSIGLIGVGISLFLGILLGGLSGYLGGWWDVSIQRTIEFIRAIPTIPLFLGLAAAVPPTWSPLLVYFILTLILAIVGWTELARVVRGRFMAMRSEDFVLSAKLDGGSDVGIIMRHMAPSFASHIIAAATLAVPGMILAETALSFLGLGLRPPFVSWGVLMQEAQNIRSIATAPWLFASGVVTVIAILAMNFLGDGLRDAADPYK